ncbi:uncharacterized protein [Elaeis guineensis]|uniref:uncharacterized protein isoform X2 n=1 Tax=Elaeis guineensis var. tenera TaxID=51953 RepID=UPI003C6D0943
MAASETYASSSEPEDHRRSRRDGGAAVPTPGSRDRPRSGGTESRLPARDGGTQRDDRRSSSGDEGSDSDGRGKGRRSMDDRRHRGHADEGQKERNHRSGGRGRGREEDDDDGSDDSGRKRDRKRRSDEDEGPRRRERIRDKGRRRYRDHDSACRRDKNRDRDRYRRKHHSDEDRSPRRRERITDNWHGDGDGDDDDDRQARRRRHRDRDVEEGHPRDEETKKVGNELPPPPPMPDSIAGRTGGIYIPPFRMAQMMREVQDEQRGLQRLSWDALRKSINGLVMYEITDEVGGIHRCFCCISCRCEYQVPRSGLTSIEKDCLTAQKSL